MRTQFYSVCVNLQKSSAYRSCSVYDARVLYKVFNEALRSEDIVVKEILRRAMDVRLTNDGPITITSRSKIINGLIKSISRMQSKFPEV